MVFEILHQNTFKRILNQEWYIIVPKLCCRHRIPDQRIQELILAKMELLNYEISLVLLGQI